MQQLQQQLQAATTTAAITIKANGIVAPPRGELSQSCRCHCRYTRSLCWEVNCNPALAPSPTPTSPFMRQLKKTNLHSLCASAILTDNRRRQQHQRHQQHLRATRVSYDLSYAAAPQTDRACGNCN